MLPVKGKTYAALQVIYRRRRQALTGTKYISSAQGVLGLPRMHFVPAGLRALPPVYGLLGRRHPRSNIFFNRRYRCFCIRHWKN
ncbi:MAG: hypothetical protein PHO01_13065 [Desulfotomaculaceae bacterium]|nr:hypothetical protein [Desulfotomaculaceae bacterium]